MWTFLRRLIKRAQPANPKFILEIAPDMYLVTAEWPSVEHMSDDEKRAMAQDCAEAIWVFTGGRVESIAGCQAALASGARTRPDRVWAEFAVAVMTKLSQDLSKPGPERPLMDPEAVFNP